MIIGVVHPDREGAIVDCLQRDIGDAHFVFGLPRRYMSPERFAEMLREPYMDIYRVIIFPVVAEDPCWLDWLYDLHRSLRRDVRRRVRLVGPDMRHRDDWREVPVAQIWPVDHLPWKLALEFTR